MINLNKLLKEADEDHKHATLPPWRYEFAYNNGGCPTADFYVPGHNNPEADNASIEMLEDDARFCVRAREREPMLVQAIRDLTTEPVAVFSVSAYLANPGLIMNHVTEYGAARIVNADGSTRMTLRR